MMTFVFILAFLLVLILVIHVLLLHSGTQIGEKGRQNMLLQNLFFIAEAVLVLAFGVMWVKFSDAGSKMYALGIAAIGIIFLIGGIMGIRGILRESPDDLVTEHLSDVRVVPAGYHNRARKIEGTVNGKQSWFLLRGADKAMAEQIKNSGKRQVTVVYHPSNRRIESIQA